jgi:hypothetical protein
MTHSKNQPLHKLLFLLALFSLVFVSGCETSTDNSDDSSQASPDTAFIGGSTDSVSLSFVENAPPNEVFDRNRYPFSVNVRVENEGEWDIMDPNKFNVKLSGIDPTAFNDPEMKQAANQALFGKKRDSQGQVIEGTITNFAFPGFSYTGNLSGNAQFTIRADACFRYGTKAVSRICIKENLLDTSDGAICQVNGEKEVQNSIAPVTITNVKESAIGDNRISYSFTVQHTGDGNLYQMDSSCENKLEKRNIVYLTVDTGLQSGLSCQGMQDGNGNPLTDATQGYVTLYAAANSGAKRIITCTQEIPEDRLGNYENLVNFELEYDYQKSAQKQILVRNN